MNKHKMKPIKTSNTVRVLTIPVGLAYRPDAQSHTPLGPDGSPLPPPVQLINEEPSCHC